MNLTSFNESINVAIIGASGAIGNAIAKKLLANPQVAKLDLFSRSELKFTHQNCRQFRIDIASEASIEAAAQQVNDQQYDLILVTTGILHGHEVMPEKSMKEINQKQLQTLFTINTIGPAIVAKHFVPLLNHQHKSLFAALSARVGSISDNRLGGWYAYRASKAALNMILKNLAIENSRRFPNTIIIGLHPGTVESNLSNPFTSHTPREKLFTPEFSAEKLLDVMDRVTANDSGKIFAWDGSVIEF